MQVDTGPDSSTIKHLKPFNQFMVSGADISSPTNTIQDRLYLDLTKREYDNFADCIQQNCFMNRHGSFVKLKKCKTKKLKNMVYNIRKNTFLLKSMIWKAQLQSIENEIKRRRL